MPQSSEYFLKGNPASRPRPIPLVMLRQHVDQALLGIDSRLGETGDMVGQVGPLGAVANVLGLKRSLKQDQLAADLLQEAQNNLKEFNAEHGTVSEIDPNAPVRRGQIIDIIA